MISMVSTDLPKSTLPRVHTTKWATGPVWFPQIFLISQGLKVHKTKWAQWPVRNHLFYQISEEDSTTQAVSTKVTLIFPDLSKFRRLRCTQYSECSGQLDFMWCTKSNKETISQTQQSQISTCYLLVFHFFQRIINYQSSRFQRVTAHKTQEARWSVQSLMVYRWQHTQNRKSGRFNFCWSTRFQKDWQLTNDSKLLNLDWWIFVLAHNPSTQWETNRPAPSLPRVAKHDSLTWWSVGFHLIHTKLDADTLTINE